MRPVRLADSAAADVEAQLDPDRAQLFRQLDLGPALDLLADDGAWESVAKPHGPGRRLTINGVTVSGFHLFAVLDDLDPRDSALVVYAIDIWSEEFPD